MTQLPEVSAERLKVLREQYAYESWHDTYRLDEALLVWQFEPMEAGLPGWRSLGIRRLTIPETPPLIRSTWSAISEEPVVERPASDARDPLAGPVLVLDIYECTDAPEARGWLLTVLGAVESTTHRLVKGGAPGDVAFAVPDGAAVAFVRANLVCVARNGGRELRSLLPTSLELDRWVTKRPAGTEGALPPELTRADAQAIEGETGEVALLVEARDPADRPVWFKCYATSGRLALVNGVPIHRPEGDVPPSLTVVAVGPGGASSRSIDTRPGAAGDGTAGPGRNEGSR